MGLRYDKGNGVEQDSVKALMWLSLSLKSAKGKTLRRAAKARGRLLGALDEKQIAEARRLAKQI